MRSVLVTSFGKTFLKCHSKRTKSNKFVRKAVNAAYKRWLVLHMRIKGNAILYYTSNGMCALSIEGIGLTNTQKVSLLRHPRVKSIELHKDFTFTLTLKHGFTYPATGKPACRFLTYSDAVARLGGV